MKKSVAFLIAICFAAPASAQTDLLETARHKIVKFTRSVDLIVNGKTPEGLQCSAEIDVEEELGNTITFDIFDISDSARTIITMISAAEVPSYFKHQDVITAISQNSRQMIVELSSTDLRNQESVQGRVVMSKPHRRARVDTVTISRGSKSITCISDEK